LYWPRQARIEKRGLKTGFYIIELRGQTYYKGKTLVKYKIFRVGRICPTRFSVSRWSRFQDLTKSKAANENPAESLRFE
jgi:hypothetical protein